jgi:hypothetical protein
MYRLLTAIDQSIWPQPIALMGIARFAPARTQNALGGEELRAPLLLFDCSGCS